MIVVTETSLVRPNFPVAKRALDFRHDDSPINPVIDLLLFYVGWFFTAQEYAIV